MKGTFLLMAVLLIGIVGNMRAQSFQGKLVDEKEAPVGFANIVLLNPVDSAFVKGTVSEESGAFRIEGVNERPYILRVSYVGYKEVFVDCPKSGSVGVIRLEPDAVTLGEAVVIGKLPTYQLKGSSLVANIRESLLSTVGTANDVLSHIPGLEGSDGKFTVFGKGEPLIYINNRLMRDPSELERLSSRDIAHVELIQNPGAEYDATVKAVLRIRTIKRAGDGFGMNFRGGYSQGEKASSMEQLSLNYRTGRLDLFGTLSYSLWQSRTKQRTGSYIRVDTLWEQKAETEVKQHFESIFGQFGANYELGERQSIGVTYEGGKGFNSHGEFLSQNTMYADGGVFDRLDYHSVMPRENSQHKVNAYYEGTFADKLNINFNADWLTGTQDNGTIVDERSETGENREVSTSNNTRNHLYAVKLVMAYPLAVGELKWGGEYSYVRRTDRFDNPQGILPSTDSRIRERKAAAFLSYSLTWKKLNANAGLRYEHVDFDYFDKGAYVPGQSRLYKNLFPDIALSMPVGKTQMSLSYTAKTRRPSFYQLRSDLQYDDRFTYEGGNPLLRPSFNHDVTYQFGYKFIQASLSYQYIKDVSAFMMRAYEPNPVITVYSQANYPKAEYLNASVSIAPKFGFWEPSLYLSVSKPFFTAVTMGEQREFNRPTGNFSLSNSFRLPKGWVFSLDGSFRTDGHQLQSLQKCTGGVNVGLRKGFLKDDALMLNLQVSDLFLTQRYSFEMYAADRNTTKWSLNDSRQVRLMVTYRFNATRSKYKGSGAANDVINRL